MASNDVIAALKLISEEKGLPYESVLETLETALAAAYRKDFGTKQQNIKVEFNPETGEMKVYDVKTVVPDMDLEVLARLAQEEAAAREEALSRGEEPPETDPNRPRFNPKTDMMFTEAQQVKPDVQIGEELRMVLEVPSAFGRMAAQTAKQVIVQKLREAERDMVFSEFKDRQGEILLGTVQRREGRNVLVDLGRGTGIVLASGQVPGERYESGMRYKFLLESVSVGSRGPELLLSRTHELFVGKIFENEIPEITSGSVVIKGIAREAGSRSKVAVWTDEDGVDPVGACIGQRGTRIQTIIHELGGEKIDIIQYDEDPSTFIKQALSPAKVTDVLLQEDGTERIATATVAEDQFSLAIGKGGQNVRLAAKLTGWKININQEGVSAEAETIAEEAGAPDVADEIREGELPPSEDVPAEEHIVEDPDSQETGNA